MIFTGEGQHGVHSRIGGIFDSVAFRGVIKQAVVADIAQHGLHHSVLTIQALIAAAHGSHPGKRSQILAGNIQRPVGETEPLGAGREGETLEDVVPILGIDVVSEAIDRKPRAFGQVKRIRNDRFLKSTERLQFLLFQDVFRP